MRFFKLSVNCDPSIKFFQLFIPKCPFNAISTVPIFYYFFTAVIVLSVVELLFFLQQKIYINENNIDNDNYVMCTLLIRKLLAGVSF